MFHSVVTWSLLALALLQPACEGSSLGAVVHVVPLDSSTVRAHFTVLAPLVKYPSPALIYSCPDLSGGCASGEPCMNHTTSDSLPTNITSPWCVRQWQKTVPSHYNATITLGSSVAFYLSFKATPTVRPNNGGLNRPPYVGLPPPLRARKDCPHHYHLSVKDLDGDTLRCRFAGPVECPDCTLHTFIELDQEHCMVTFTGRGPVGQYFFVVMVEDHYPAPKIVMSNNQALSSVPVHLSLTVEQPTPLIPCSAEPLASSQTPRENALLDVLLYEQVDVTVSFISQLERYPMESVSDIAVVGPPALFRFNLTTAGSLASMNLSWVRGPNSLAPLLPICYTANTNSLQSDTRCLWLYQRQVQGLPAGSVLTCEATEMSLVLAVSSLNNIQLSELQLNSAGCPVTYNSTHLTALISLTGCGTKTVHSGTELVYTNTLRSVRPFTTVSRLPNLVLPLACRIPGLVARGPVFNVSMPTNAEVFGGSVADMNYRLEFTLVEPSSTTRFRRPLRAQAGGRAQRDASWSRRGSGSWLDALNKGSSGGAAMGSKLEYLYLSVKSDCSVPRVELLVEKCTEAESKDMARVGHVLMDNGCSTNGSTMKVIPSDSNSKVYQMDLSAMQSTGSSMYMECIVYLCIATMPGQNCTVPQCNSTAARAQRSVQNSYEGSRITVGRTVSLVVTPAPAIAVATVPAAAATTAAGATAVVAAGATTATTTTTAAAGATTATTAPTTEPGATEAVDLAATAATVAQPTASHAPQASSSITVGVLLIAVCVFLN